MRIPLVMLVVLVLAALTAMVLAAPQNPLCDNREADSSADEGAVDICGVTYFCGYADGVCPEDYADANTGTRASCSPTQGDCSYDTDCVTPVTGTVTVKDTTQRIPNALIQVEIPGLKVISAYSDLNGEYSIDIPYGLYYFSASKDGYDPEVKSYDVQVAGANVVDFQLPLGDCHADCTDWQDRCNPACDGLVFTDGTCQYYDGVVTEGTATGTFTSGEVKEACSYKLGDSRVFLQAYNASHAWYVDCCNGEPFLQYNKPGETRTDQYDSVIKYERIVRYNNKPHKLVIVVAE